MSVGFATPDTLGFSDKFNLSLFYGACFRSSAGPIVQVFDEVSSRQTLRVVEAGI